MKENLVILDPAVESAQMRGMRSAVSKSLLNGGEFPLVQNLRSFSGEPTTRGGTDTFLTMPTALSGATIIDMWSGPLNGTWYLVAAFLVSSKYEIWVSEAGANLYRLSEVGGWHGGTTGDSRFTSLTGRIEFCPVKIPQTFVAGAVAISARDGLLVSNGQDHTRLFDPARATSATISISSISAATPQVVTTSTNHNLDTGDTVTLTLSSVNYSYWITRISATTFSIHHNEALDSHVASGTHTGTGSILFHFRFAIHQPVTVPADATLFTQRATFAEFWPVRGASGKAYFSGVGPPIVNDTSGTNQFNWAASNYDVYNNNGTNTNSVVAWTWGTLVIAGQISTVYFASESLYLGRGLIIFTEDVTTAFGAATMFSHVKIEANITNAVYDNAATIAAGWVTIYDPFSSNSYETRFENVLLAGPDTDPPRYMWFFPTDHLSNANRTIFHLRVARSTNAPNPTVTAQVMILAICGAGAFQGGSEFTLSYEDAYGVSESYGIVAGGGPSADAEPIGAGTGGGIPPPSGGGGTTTTRPPSGGTTA